MFWGSSGKKADEPKTFDENKLPSTKKLPRDLQKMLDQEDKEDNFMDDFVSGYSSDSTDSNVRYAAYAARFRTILMSAHRYVAYTSDVGESFRPVAHPNLVRTAYGISWAYILGDVSYEGYKAYLSNQRILNPGRTFSERQKRLVGVDALPPIFEKSTDAAERSGGKAIETIAPPAAAGLVSPLEDWRTVMAQRAIFQSIASMGLPAFTIHSVVRYSGQALKNVKNKTIRTWGPIGLGLAVVPFLPTLFDKPVENAVEYVFHKGFEQVGGKAAVGEAPVVGRESQLHKKPKEKEL